MKVMKLYENNKEKFRPLDTKGGVEIRIMPVTRKVAGIKASVYWNIITFGKCRIYAVYIGEVLVHTTYVMERCYKFPFLNKNNRDIEIGPCYTKEEYRGQGIYPYVLSCILNDRLNKKNKAYMLISEKNISSQKGVEKVGFTESHMVRKDRLKRYVVTE